MSDLNCITVTQEIEIDLIELAYDYVDSVDDIKTLLDGISSHTVDLYKEELAEEAKEALVDNINDVDALYRFIDNIDDSITEAYHQKVIDTSTGRVTDLIDAICCSKQDELQDVLVCILNRHPKALHQFLASKQSTVQLAMIESAQALLKDLEDYF